METRAFLSKKVLILVIIFSSITVCSQYTDRLSLVDLDQKHLKPSDTSPGVEHFSLCDNFLRKEPLRTFKTFLNDEKESPRKNLYSILQFLFTLLIYVCGVLCRNIQYSYDLFDMKAAIDQANELAATKIKYCWTSQKERLYPFCQRFGENVFANGLTSRLVYYFFGDEHQRAVSFISLKESSPVSIFSLARDGFYYVPNDQLVKCSGCGKSLSVKDFNNEPFNEQFHASSSCPFVMRVPSTTSQEALGSQKKDYERKHNADTASESLPPPSIKGQGNKNKEPTETSYAIGGQQNEPDKPSINSRSMASMPTDYEDSASRNDVRTSCPDGSPVVSNFLGGGNVASTRETVDDTKVPRNSTHSTKEGEKGYDSPRHQSTSKDGRPKSGHSSSNYSTAKQQPEPQPSCSKTDDKSQGTGARPKTGTPPPEKSPGGSPVYNHDDGQTEPFAYWRDKRNFDPQCSFIKSESKQQEQRLNWTEACPKNDVHDGFFAVDTVTLSQFPESLQFNEFHQFVLVSGNLTVKLRVKFTSADRPHDDPYRSQKCANMGYRCGSGFIIPESKNDEAEELIKEFKKKSPKSKRKKVKRLLSHPMGKTTKSYFTVRTTRHLVFDNSEAKSTEVILDIQDTTNRSVKRYRGKGVLVLHEKVEGNYRSLLVCKTHEPDLGQILEKEREHFATLMERLPRQVMKELLDDCFVISHPHGLNKTVTFGQSTIVKYVLRHQGQDGASRRQFVKRVHDKKEAPTQDIREVLMYTAGTCSGSSGAAVFFCRNVRQVAGGDVTTQLVTWTHNGVEKQSGLSCSVMNSYQPELTEGIKISPVDNPRPSTKETNSSPANPASVAGPKAPKYIFMQARLDSFKDGYKSACKHSPRELATAGFFFAGYEDCVKCFSCGLGLKGWNSTSDINAEHERRMPDCNFLKAHKNTVKELVPALLFDEKETSDEPFKATLLKSERKKLAAMFTCKVCWRLPASELFLACGDIFACERCADFLYNCPECGKQIYATVTTYLS